MQRGALSLALSVLPEHAEDIVSRYTHADDIVSRYRSIHAAPIDDDQSHSKPYRLSVRPQPLPEIEGYSLSFFLLFKFPSRYVCVLYFCGLFV